MKFKFSLEKVLGHRKSLENMAQVDFQVALANLKAEEAVLEEMKNKIALSRDQAFDYQTTPQDHAPKRLQQVEEFIKGQHLRIKIQEAKIQKMEDLVEGRRQILRTRVVESKILERLKERKQSDFELEASRKEQIETDDLNLIRLKLKEK